MTSPQSKPQRRADTKWSLEEKKSGRVACPGREEVREGWLAPSREEVRD